MKKLASIGLAVALSSCATTPVFSEEVCPTYVEQEVTLLQKFGETPIAAFNFPDTVEGRAVSTIFFVNVNTRTWTQIALFKNGNACFYANGVDFIVLPDSANGERG